MRTDYNRFQKWKVMKYSDRINLILNNGIPYPVEWVIYPSNICGYQCPHCIMARTQIDHRNTFSAEAMKRIPLDAVKMKIECVVFSGGGDPLLNPLTLDTARSLKILGIPIGINNQGYLLDDPTPFDFIRYSVDAVTPETYKLIHGVDGWDRVNKNIRHHFDLRQDGHKIEMGLAFLITPWNYCEVAQFVDWAQQWHPDFIHIRPAFLDADYLDAKYHGGGDELKNTIIPNLQSLAERLQQDHDNVYFRVDKFEGFWTEKKYSKCRANSLMAVTSGDGAFLVCQDRGIRKEDNALRWGNYNTQSFEEIWFSDEHRKVMESIDLKKCPRCVEVGYNEIIENVFVNDGLKAALL
jgi:MoaA/NifB/PqqE/SkfB family radical SAM enzyme